MFTPWNKTQKYKGRWQTLQRCICRYKSLTTILNNKPPVGSFYCIFRIWFVDNFTPVSVCDGICGGVFRSSLGVSCLVSVFIFTHTHTWRVGNVCMINVQKQQTQWHEWRNLKWKCLKYILTFKVWHNIKGCSKYILLEPIFTPVQEALNQLSV